VFTAEGLVGLPRAFLFSGTPRVIASSWRVDDAATRALMTKFYELWRDRGLRASAALAQAQDAVRSDERWRHPRYWAPWTLWGSGD
jgi:CHAT domain-containing protein